MQHRPSIPPPGSNSSFSDDVVLEPVPAHSSSSHHHHGASTPLTELNETEILLHHQPNPLSYWTHDWNLDATDERLGGRGQWGGWIVWGHALGMTVGLLLLFPLAHALRSTPYSTPILFLTLLLALIGLLSSAVYKSRTPDLYAHNSHGPLGWIVVVLLLALSGWDFWRACEEMKEGGWKTKMLRLVGVPSRKEARETYELVGDVRREEQVGLHTIQEGEEEEEGDEEKLGSIQLSSPVGPEEEEVVLFSPSSPAESPFGRVDEELSPRSSTSTLRHHHHHSHSHSSQHQPILSPAPTRLQGVLLGFLSFLWFLVPVLGVASFLSGITVYSGACRAEYSNGCFAHLIKGAIFLLYGLATFARYLGSWAEYGWAWNVRPTSRRTRKRGGWRVPSAEAAECTIIFLYGLTNTWMERFGALPGSSFTIHQVQHISIALMFFFGGGMGLLLESTLARKLLAAPVAIMDGRGFRSIEKPPTWSGSFNPFPALVIGVTGLVMSSHHQTYLFQIQIHALWGNLLALFGVFRILTYAFLWLRPPRSILPSRPPTEALAAFAVSCGGVVFILSNEQVVYGAMRAGWDDVMSFLTLTISNTSFLFIWLFFVLLARGWAVERSRPLDASGRKGSSSTSASESSASAFDRVGGRV
ncbi:hypothetical protein BDY24DRAFT_337910 [Mrakia frigida]|uniref:Tvs1p n=1 Tax=Mrakia frigida TaxID=29902 RepID=UPI003FCC21C7